MNPEKKCARPECLNSFTQKSGAQLYCSPECRREHYNIRRYKNSHPTLPPGTVGAIGEFRVAADLLSKDFDVFRSMSPHCWTDIVFMNEQGMWTLEVKTGIRTPAGRLSYPTPKHKTDFVAVVLHEEIVYIPELPKSTRESDQTN